MPMVRYEMRNEYALADPELYRSADRDDPEALLEGVAMAGLVGLLRQLGDLAEFSAKIFHELHEEVMVTSARGHRLMLRAEQLETEFPLIEKAFLSQTNYSQFTGNAGIAWHSNVRVDQKLITRGDMPHFILDSYEECRGPPRLFMLDKFDTTGAGACLKRYSDPSFFKAELASSGMIQPGVQREKRVRKVKKKVSRWRNGVLVESSLQSLMNSNLQPEISKQLAENNSTWRVKLKSSHPNGMGMSRSRSYMESLLEVHSLEEKLVWKNSEGQSIRMIKSTVSASESDKTQNDNSCMDPSFKESTAQPPNKQTTEVSADEQENQKINGEGCYEVLPELFGDAKKLRSTFEIVEKKERLVYVEGKAVGSTDSYSSNKIEENIPVLHMASQKKLLTESDYIEEGFSDGYMSDDFGSKVERYMDALDPMESETETDSESRGDSDQSLCTVLSDTKKGRQELVSQSLESDSVEDSEAPLVLKNMFYEEMSTISSSGVSSGFTDVLGTTHSRLHAEESISEDMGDKIDMWSHDSYNQDGSIHGQLSAGCAEYLLLQRLEESRKHEREASGGSISPKTTPVYPGIISIVVEPDGLATEMESDVQPELLTAEISTGSLINISEVDKYSDGSSFRDVNITERYHPMNDHEEVEDMKGTYGMFDDLSQTQREVILEKVPSGYVEDLLPPSTVHVGEPEDSTQYKTEVFSGGTISPRSPATSQVASEASFQCTSVDSELQSLIVYDEKLTYLQSAVDAKNDENIIKKKKVMLNAFKHMMEHVTNEYESQGSCYVEAAGFVTLGSGKEACPGGMQLQSNVEAIDGPLTVSSSLRLSVESEASDDDEYVSQIEQTVQCAETGTAESVTEYTDTMSSYSVEPPDFSILQGDSVPGGVDLEHHKLDISEVSIPNHMPELNSENMPCIFISSGNENLQVSVSAVSSSGSESFNTDFAYSNDANLFNSLCPPMTPEHSKIDLHPHIDEDNLVQPFQDEDEFSSEVSQLCLHERAKEEVQPAFSDKAVSKAQISNEPNETSSHKVKLLDPPIQLEVASSVRQGNTRDDFVEQNDQSSKPGREQKCQIVVNGGNISEFNIPSSNTAVEGQSDPETNVPVSPNMSSMELPPLFEVGDHGISEFMPQQFSAEIISYTVPNSQLDHVQEAPPLPPLPPLPPVEWRMGKLGLGFLMSDRNLVQPLAGANPFSAPNVHKKHLLGLVPAEVAMPHPANMFTPFPLQALEERIPLPGLLGSEIKMIQPLRLSDLPPIVKANGYQHVDRRQMVHPLSQSSLESPVEGDKHLNSHDASCRGMLHTSNQSARLQPLEDEAAQHLQIVGANDHTLEDKGPRLGQFMTALDLERSRYGTQGIERELLQSVGPCLVVASAEVDTYQYDLGGYEGENMQYVSLSAPVPTTGTMMPLDDFASSRENYPFAQDDRMILTMEDEKPNGKLSSIRNWPRHPLIDAVAAHDKSTLRKVSELVPSSDKPKATERNTLLEQIRNKSFDLKPAAVTKLNIQGPSTNLNVAAILEKANAIRQACAGSDEEDEGDSWSDS